MGEIFWASTLLIYIFPKNIAAFKKLFPSEKSPVGSVLLFFSTEERRIHCKDYFGI